MKIREPETYCHYYFGNYNMEKAYEYGKEPIGTINYFYDKKFILYTEDILNSYDKYKIENIVRTNKLTSKSFDKMSKKYLIQMILDNKVKYDADLMEIEMRKIKEENDAKEKKKQEEQEAKDKKKKQEREQKEQMKQEEKDRKRRKEQDEKDERKRREKEEKEKRKINELVSFGVPNLTSQDEINNTNAEFNLGFDSMTKPYFSVLYKIPKYLSARYNTFQETKFNILDTINKDIITLLKINRKTYEDNKAICTIDKQEEDYFIYNVIIIIDNHKINPITLKNISKFNQTCTGKVKYSITYDTEIYNEGYNLENIKAKLGNDYINCYDIDGDFTKIVLEINKSEYVSKEMRDKSETIVEFIDRKKLLWINNNIEYVSEICYNKKKEEDGFVSESLEEFTKGLTHKINQYYTYFTDYDDYSKNSIKVVNIPKYGFEDGRKYSKLNFTKQALPKVIRHTLSKDLYKDIDLVKAHFIILKNIINKTDSIDKGKCKFLLSFIDDIDNAFNEYKKYFPNMDKSLIKKKLISILFDDNINIETHLFKSVPSFKNFVNDIQYLQDLFYNMEEYKHIVLNVERLIKTKIDNIDNADDLDKINDIKKNKLGKVLSRILQEKENKILECILSYFKEKNIEYGALQFDGCEVLLSDSYKKLKKDLPYKNFKLDDNLLKDIEAYVLKNINYDVKLCYKELDDALELPYDYIYSFERCYLMDNKNDTELALKIISLISHNVKKRKIGEGLYELLYYCDNKYVKGDNFVLKYISDCITALNIYTFRKKERIQDHFDNLKKNEFRYEIYSNFKDSIINDKTNADTTFLKNITKFVFDNLENKVEDITDKLYHSTLNKWCFQDGVYDLITKKFTKWGAGTRDIYSVNKINRDCFYNRKEELQPYKEFILERYYDCYKPENYDLCQTRFKLLSRISGGNNVDKLALLVASHRNSWKTLEGEFLAYTFGEYVCYLDVDTFVYKRNCNKDSGLKNMYLINGRDARFAILSETKGTDGDAVSKTPLLMDSAFMKNIIGGDYLIAREVHEKKRYIFKTSIQLIHYCNNPPIYTNKDLLNTKAFIKTDFGFLSKRDPDYNEYQYKEPKLFGENNDTDLKNLILNDYRYADAFLMILDEFFEPKKIELPQKMYDDINQLKEVSNQSSYNNVFLEYFKPADDNNKKLHKTFVENDMLDYIKEKYEGGIDKNYDKILFKQILQKLNIKTDKGSLEGFKGTRLHFYRNIELKNEGLISLYETFKNNKNKQL